jgi:hypothetical protein
MRFGWSPLLALDKSIRPDRRNCILRAGLVFRAVFRQIARFQAASNRPNSADSMKTSSQSPKARPYGSLAPWPKW